MDRQPVGFILAVCPTIYYTLPCKCKQVHNSTITTERAFFTGESETRIKREPVPIARRIRP